MSKNELDAITENFLKVFPVVIKYFILLGDKCADPQYTYQDYQTLHVLKDLGKVPISTVGNMLLISKSRMTALVDKLMEAKLIERFPDAKDRRIINIGLTDKGNMFTFEHRQKLKASLSKRFGQLSVSEMEQFIESMMTLQEVMAKTETEEIV